MPANKLLKQPVYLVAGCRPWVREAFNNRLSRLPGCWVYYDNPAQLTLSRLKQLKPRAVFVVHWSWKISPEILSQFECVGFHMTDLPYGRGGSPLQHLILRGHKQTKLSALRLTDQMDAGPIYMKRRLSLGGSAEAIYKRTTALAVKMITQIIRNAPKPVAQQGKAVTFLRRKPSHSRIEGQERLREMYDFIRMLDASGYPRAYLDYKHWRFVFSKASCRGGRLTARVAIESKNGAAA